MADAPKSLEEQLQEQQESLGNQIKELETQLMRAKEGYLKVQGALEILAIQKQQAEPESTTTEVVDP